MFTDPDGGFRALVEQLPDVVARFDADLRFVYVNPAIETMTGLPREAFADRTARDLLMPASVVDDWDDAIRATFATGTARDWDFAYETPDARRWFHAVAVPERDEHGSIRFVCLAARDVTRLKELEARLAREAREDHLTGLASRRHFQRIGDLAAAKTMVGLCLIDLDNFKAVNDELGHTVGDAVLVVIANRLRRAVRPTDLVGRYGGDEFVILITEDASPAEIAAVAERAVAAFRDPIRVGPELVTVTASVGVVIGTGTVEELIERADSGLYTAKHEGKDRWALGR